LAVRIRNQKQSHRTLGLSTLAWRELLKMALKYGWQPMGGVIPDTETPAQDFYQAGLSLVDWDYLWTGREGMFAARRPEALLETYLPLQYDGGDWLAEGNRLVLLEDALNLVDALDRAYQAYEPVKVPASYFLFEPDDPALTLRPSLGALVAAIEVCSQGSFSIEPWRYRV